MTDEILIRTGGIYCLVFAVFHLFFWKLFDWQEDLQSLSFINRAVVQILNLCLTFCFVIFGYISLAHTDELIGTPLGRALLLLLTIFLVLRAIEQVWFFGLRRWASVAFFVAFVLGAGLYGWPWLRAVIA